MDTALDRLRAEGHDVRREDVARLSPLGFDHIDFGSAATCYRTPMHDLLSIKTIQTLNPTR
jgi:hypothetical protein